MEVERGPSQRGVQLDEPLDAVEGPTQEAADEGALLVVP